jgi:hypothetical protein
MTRQEAKGLVEAWAVRRVFPVKARKLATPAPGARLQELALIAQGISPSRFPCVKRLAPPSKLARNRLANGVAK